MTVEPVNIGFTISAILTGVAAIIGAWKGISADKKAVNQEAAMKTQENNINKALSLEKRLIKIEDREDDLNDLKVRFDSEHKTVHDHGERLVRFEERVGKLESLPEKIDQLRDTLAKSETDRARSEGAMTTKLDMILNRLNQG